MFGECSWTYRGRARRSATSYQSKPSLIFAQPSFERLIAKARELDEQAQAMSCFAESSIAGRMGCIGLWHLTSVPVIDQAFEEQTSLIRFHILP